MKKILLMAVAAMMATVSVDAQNRDETQGVGGKVLDSLYTVGSNDVRRMKCLYEYTEAKLPRVKWTLSYYDEEGNRTEEPVTDGRDTYTYDEQNRLRRQESASLENGALRVTNIQEIAEYHAETSVPALIYNYKADQNDPEATPQLTQKGVITKCYGSVGMEDMEIYSYDDGEWTFTANVHYDYNENDLVQQETYSLNSIRMVTIYEYDDHGQMIQKTVKQEVKVMEAFIELSSMTRTFTNEYYDDGNLKKTSEIDDETFIETVHYFWSNGSGTAIRDIQTAIETLDRTFDLSGRIVTDPSTRKGIYIQQGKKVFIK